MENAQPPLPSLPPTEVLQNQVSPSPKPNQVPLGIALILSLVLAGIVGAGGYYLGTQRVNPAANKYETAPISSPELAQEPTQDLPLETTGGNPNENWLTYTNSIYLYSFKYPAGWLVTDESLKSLASPTSNNIFIFDPKIDVEDTFYSSLQIEKVGMIQDISSLEAVTINSLKMYKDDTLHGEVYYVNLPDTDQYVRIIGAGGYTNSPERNEILRAIFATFAFVPAETQ
jgi:hypothetical protein